MMVFGDGTKYTGSWADNKLQGRATVKYTDGSVFDG